MQTLSSPSQTVSREKATLLHNSQDLIGCHVDLACSGPLCVGVTNGLCFLPVKSAACTSVFEVCRSLWVLLLMQPQHMSSLYLTRQTLSFTSLLSSCTQGDLHGNLLDSVSLGSSSPEWPPALTDGESMSTRVCS